MTGPTKISECFKNYCDNKKFTILYYSWVPNKRWGGGGPNKQGEAGGGWDPTLQLNSHRIQTCNTVIYIFNIRITIWMLIQ